MSKIKQRDVIEDASLVTKLIKVDVEKNKKQNLLNPRKVEEGSAVKAITDKLQMDKEVTPLQIHFSQIAKHFGKRQQQKMLEMHSLKYPGVSYRSPLDAYLCPFLCCYAVDSKHMNAMKPSKSNTKRSVRHIILVRDGQILV